MPPKVDQATIIILDIGRNVSTPEEKKEKSFFEKARECTSRIIERKIMSKGNNLLGVLLLGSKNTKNRMAEVSPGAFRRIEMYKELQEPTWEMIRNLPDKPTNKAGDWLDALVVAADHFMNGNCDTKKASKKVILITNFQTPSSLDSNDAEKVLNKLIKDGLELDVIGPDIKDEKQQSEDIKRARQFVESTNGQTASFKDTMSYLMFHRKKHVYSKPWDVDLSIGSKVLIPISCYIRLEDYNPLDKWQKAVLDPDTLKASTTEYNKKKTVYYNAETLAIVDSENVIKGYQYGQEYIPFTEVDKKMFYVSDEQSIAVYGFTAAENLSWQNLNGVGLHYIFGRKGDKKAQKAIRCFVECLRELNLVGIVRRVYNKGNAAKMFSLMPVTDTNNFICLSMAGICFKEVKNMAFPPTSLKKHTCTDEQINAFKDLINAMDLTNAYDETYDELEAFPIAETVSPSAQYMLDCIAYRAMNPGKPLPQPRDDIMMLFKVPPLIQDQSREPLDKLRKLFTLNRLELVKKNDQSDNPLIQNINEPSTSDQSNRQFNTDMSEIRHPIKKIDEIYRIGTINPVSDFKALTAKGKTLTDLTPEITEVIENLIYCNLDGDYTKAFDAMKFFRTGCVTGDPAHYNNWLMKFKMALSDRKKHDIVSHITENNLGFILKEENSLSTYDSVNSHEDSQMYETDTVPNSTLLNIQPDVNDLFDSY